MTLWHGHGDLFIPDRVQSSIDDFTLVLLLIEVTNTDNDERVTFTYKANTKIANAKLKIKQQRNVHRKCKYTFFFHLVQVVLLKLNRYLS